MVLYALTVIASFLYLEVRELKQTFSRELANASDWFKISLALAETKAGEAAPAVAIKKLLWTWHDIYTDASGATPHLVNPTRRTLVCNLLSTYVSEEIADARANQNPQRIPRTVRLPTTTDVMYLATNVGFYASFLAEALKRLGLLSDRGVPSIATVTYALPAFWWNWPKVTPHGEYHDYQPISAFRWTLEQLVGSDMAIYDPKTCDHLLTLASGHSLGQGFRRVIVYDDSWTSLEKALVTEAQWKKSTGWKILLQKPSQENPHGRVAHSMSMDLTTGDRAHLISGLQWTNGLKGKEAYWIIDADTEREGFVARDLLQFFRERMHAGSRGNTLIMPISQPIFESPFFVDPDEKGDQGLNGCSEITFLGLCKDDCKDAWTDDRDWGDWG